MKKGQLICLFILTILLTSCNYEKISESTVTNAPETVMTTVSDATMDTVSETAEIEPVLEDYVFDDKHMIKYKIDFLNDDQNNIYCTASYLYSVMHFCGGSGGQQIEYDSSEDFWKNTVVVDNNRYCKTRINYQSYYDFLGTVFTEKGANDFINMYDIENSDGMLLLPNRDGIGGNPCHKYTEHKLISQTDDRIEFNEIESYSLEGVEYENYEQYLMEVKEEDREDNPYEWSITLSQVMVNNGDGWRIDQYQFEY